jgi:phospholipid/cholesterol/gamma-HCH transport system permease protein
MANPFQAIREVGSVAMLTGRAFAALVKPPYEIREWFRQAEQIGVRSLGVASITTVFTGMVLALQTAYSRPSTAGTSLPGCRDRP